MLWFYAPRGVAMAKTLSLYGSSIGQKIVSALTGLFLCVFLVIHVSGNLLLFKNDGGVSFNQYAAAASSSLLIRSIEIVLFAGFAIHIFWGVRVWIFNRRARPKNYAECHPSENSSLFSRIMLLSGVIVLFFLIVHLKNFWVPIRFGAQDLSDFELVRIAFENPLYDLFYIPCLVLLAFHLRQGFQSAFQSVGLRPLWLKAIDMVAIIFWLLIPAAFAAMPLYFLLAKGGR
jgi:succinate dehydrogenase / fumarate reductase, cytochrome b subunit